MKIGIISKYKSILLDKLSNLNESSELGSNLPQKLLGLDSFDVIIPYAFRQSNGIEAATKQIEVALADRLTGVDNDDRLIELSGIKFEESDFHDRVRYFIV